MLQTLGQPRAAARLLARLDRPSTSAVIVLAGLLLRLALLSPLSHAGFVSDAQSYDSMASALLAGTHFVPFWPPGLPLYLAAVQALAGHSALLERISMLPFYLGLCLAAYRLATQVAGRPAAGAIALLPIALMPEMVLASLEPWTELPTAMFLAFAALCLLRQSLKPRIACALALGLALGCLALLRPASLVLLLLVPAYLYPRSRGLWRTATPVLLALAIVAVWIGHVYATTGRLVAINTANARNLYIGNNVNTPLYRTWWLGSHHAMENAALPIQPTPATDPTALQQESSHVAWATIRSRPDLFLLRTFNRVCVFFSFDPFTGAYLIENYGVSRPLGMAVIALDALLFVALGFAAILRLLSSPCSPSTLLMFGLCLLYAAPYFVAFSHPRYHVPIQPLLWAAAAAWLTARLAGDRPAWTPRWPPLATVAALTVFLLLQVEFLLLAGRASAS